jgi:hypothetical protein
MLNSISQWHSSILHQSIHTHIHAYIHDMHTRIHVNMAPDGGTSHTFALSTSVGVDMGAQTVKIDNMAHDALSDD